MLSLAERFSFPQRIALYFDPVEPQRIGRRGWILFSLLLLVFALPSLWAPFDGDQALFFVSGEKLLRGDVLYRDIVDLKPPLIYFLYAAAIGIFGESVLAVRLIELLVQAGVIWLIARTARRASGNDVWGMLSALFYAALYFSLPFYCRGQVEGFAALPIAGIFSLLSVRRRGGSNRSLPVLGLLAGALVLLKTSFLAILPLVLFFLLFERDAKLKRWIGRSAIVCAGAAFPVALVFVYLWMADGLADFTMMQQFTGGYAAAQWGSFLTPLTLALREIPWYFVTTWSVSLALLTAGGMYRVLFYTGGMAGFSSAKEDEGDDSAGRSDVWTLLFLSLVSFLLLLATVAVEAKYLTWHFNRLFVPGALLAGWGGVSLLRRLVTVRMNALALSVAVLLVPVAFLYSPLIRYSWNNAAFISGALNGTAGFSRFIGMEDDSFNMVELERVGEYVRAHREAEGKLFAASGWGGAIHYYAGDVPDFKLYHSCYLIAPYAPEEWRRQTVRYLLQERPQFIVAQRDSMPHITGVNTTSFAMLHSLPGVDSLLQAGYRVAMETEMTVVYERK